MLVRIPNLLTAEETARCRDALGGAAWADGRVTAGEQSARVKSNLQLAAGDPVGHELGELILGALRRDQTFVSAALPRRVFPPLFNRYDAGMGFGGHVDNAIRYGDGSGAGLRTDLSATLFLTDPDDYDGGELVIEDVFGEQAVKLPAGDLVLYPASSVHRVNPVTRGARLASFFWIQSMVRDDGQRTLLFNLDGAIRETRAALGDENAAAVKLTGTYHNLVRMWAEV